MKLFEAVQVSPFVSTIPLCLGTLKECRRAIAEAIREDRRNNPRRLPKLWQDRPAGNMKAGDFLSLHYGKHGYHVKACYAIREAAK